MYEVTREKKQPKESRWISKGGLAGSEQSEINHKADQFCTPTPDHQPTLLLAHSYEINLPINVHNLYPFIHEFIPISLVSP